MIFDFSAPIKIDEPTEEEIQSHFENVTSSKAWAKESGQYGLNSKTEYHKHRVYRIEEEIKQCSEWRSRWDFKNGCLRQYQYKCKHYKECSKCRKQRIKNEVESAYNYLGQNVLTGSQNEVAEILKAYSKEDYALKPLENDQSMVILKKSLGIGEPFTQEHIQILEQEFLTHGRRTSGSLKKDEPAPVVIEKGEQVEIEFRDMKIDFNSELENAPKDLQELETIVQNEAQLDHHPDTGYKLQYAIAVLENKTKEVCERFEIEFNFYSKKKRVGYLNEIDWEWLKLKLLN